MIRLHMIVEGQTEQRFAQNLLAPHLAAFNVFLDVRCVYTSKGYRGGMSSYGKAQNDIKLWIKQDSHAECRFTTMFDLYALPNDFPGHANAAQKNDPYERVRCLEESLAQSVGDARFIPYIQLHEFETLILAAPENLDAEYLEHESRINNLITMVRDSNPELINDGPETAPSKRILREIPRYKKMAGVAVVKKTGLPTLRQKCHHFDEWVLRLENLARTNP
jgi:hypothetical protein